MIEKIKKAKKVIIVISLVVALTAAVVLSQKFGISSKLFQGRFSIMNIFRSTDPGGSRGVIVIDKEVQERKVQNKVGNTSYGPGPGP